MAAKIPKCLTHVNDEKMRSLFDDLMLDYVDYVYETYDALDSKRSRRQAAADVEALVNGTKGRMTSYQKAVVHDALEHGEKRLNQTLRSKRKGDVANARLSLQMINIWKKERVRPR